MPFPGLIVLDEHADVLGPLLPAIEAQLAKGLYALAIEGVGYVEDEFDQPKSGRIYHHAAHGHDHQASAPGEPPAIDTSALSDSIRVEKTGPLEVTILVGDGSGKAAALEYGRADGSIAPRPFITPMIEHVIRPGIAELLGDLKL